MRLGPLLEGAAYVENSFIQKDKAVGEDGGAEAIEFILNFVREAEWVD